MDCGWVKKRLVRYVESDLMSFESMLLRLHLTRCNECYKHYERLDATSGLLAAIPRPVPSPRLQTRILSAFSIEVLRRSDPTLSWRRRRLKLGNLLRPVAVPALGGMLVALVIVPVLLSAFWMGPTAHADDIPLRLLAHPLATAPVMAMRSPYPVDHDFTVLVYIDMHGGVYDYEVASDEPLDRRVRGQLGNALLTSRFEPAQRFGQPIPGHAVILFQRIDSLT